MSTAKEKWLLPLWPTLWWEARPRSGWTSGSEIWAQIVQTVWLSGTESLLSMSLCHILQ